MAEHVLDQDSEAEFDRYLRLACEGTLTAEDRDRFECLMRENPVMKRRYVEYVGLHAELTWRYRMPSNTEPMATVPSTLARQSLDYALQKKRWINATVVLVTGAAMLLAVWLGSSGPWAVNHPLVAPEMLTEKKLALPERDDKAMPDAIYVARIVKASSDCRWGEMTSPVEFLVRVRAGDHLHIAAGLVELEFFSGARIILHGPAVFRPTGVASGHLESGRLTGEVADGNFRLMTPAAEVIDLGTSFGVAADAAVGTDVVVFDGHVQVVSRAEGRGSEPLDMTEGMAARFRVDGSTQYGLHTDAESFRRTVAPGQRTTAENELSLIDVIAGGDGTGKRLAGAIDPLTGKKDFGERRRRQPTRRANRFQETSWHPMIDGVFIPQLAGKPTQIDSQGHQVSFAVGQNRGWGPVWARSKESLQELNTDLRADFWGDRTIGNVLATLSETQHGLVGMHANVGLTIDLRAIQLTHRRPVAEFRAAVGNIENSDEFPEEDGTRRLTASFHVYVDGQVRHQRLEFERRDGMERFTIALTPEDRFLTLVATDDGETVFDHVVLVDPVVSLLNSQ